ncbi:MAG: hypothetical protein RR598_06975 [Anaerorhabdus sp.]
MLWIEDNINETINNMIKIVEDEIKERLYQCVVFRVANIEEAYIKMNESYIDIIFSDYNLEEEGKTGLDLLADLRMKNNYKFYVLYSNNPQDVIARDVAEKIINFQRMRLFSNFSFFSAGSKYENELEEIVEQFMDEKSKIEQLRNIYIICNSILDDQLCSLSIMGCNYYERINKFIEDKFTGNDKITAKNLWHKVRKKRNAFAHGTQVYVNGGWEITGEGLPMFFVNDHNYKDFLKEIEDLESLLKQKGLVLFSEKQIL